MERIVGPLEFVARPDGGARLMLPVSVLVVENERNRAMGIMEITPLCRMDLRVREVMSLGKREVAKVLGMKPGDELTLVRKGWGREWWHRIRRT